MEVDMIAAATKRSQSARSGLEKLPTQIAPTFIKAFYTELNWMAVAWRDDALARVAFGHASQRQAELALARQLRVSHESPRLIDASHAFNAPGWVNELADDLKRFAAGMPVDFSHVVLNLNHLTPFARRVVDACRQISWGSVRTYGELAEECCAPGAARAVGSVMAKNRFPLIVPCHRVLAAGGALGGYSAPDGLNMKRRLLAMEGSEF
jgi:methylated-DNA-[protein]-cysteine S-methyltransferase